MFNKSEKTKTNKKIQVSNLNPLDLKDLVPLYKKHIDDDMLICGDHIIASIKMFGTNFQAVDKKILHNQFLSLSRLLTNLGNQYSNKLSIWATLKKSKDFLKNKYEFKDNVFLQKFTEEYLQEFKNEKFFSISYYLTFGLKITDLLDTQENMRALIKTVMSGFNQYDCSLLKASMLNDDVAISELQQFLYSLINYNDDVIQPLSSEDYHNNIVDSDIFFNYDFFELRNKTTNTIKYGTTYNLKSFPPSTYEGTLDKILETKTEFIFTQSLNFLTASHAKKLIGAQQSKLEAVEDSSYLNSDELEQADADISDSVISLVNYHASLIIYGDSPKQAIDNGIDLTTSFITHAKGLVFEKATFDSVQSFVSHLPLSKYRPNKSIRTNLNFACLYSLHNFFRGKATGNPIGDGTALLPLKTSANGLYYLNTHLSNLMTNNIGDKIAGHVLILGSTGFGKTTLEAVILGFAQRFDPNMFVIDYNCSTELYLRAYGGEYFTIKESEYTGLNPFQLEENASPLLRSFLYQLVFMASKDQDGKLSDQDKKYLEDAVDTVLELPIEHRRFDMLLHSITHSDLRVRLSKWCIEDNGKKGAYEWVLNSPVNKFNPMNFKKIGFDTTTILKLDNEVTEVVLSILFFYKELMQREGKLLYTVVEEFHKACYYDYTAKHIATSLKAGRLKNEVVFLISQSPADAINSPISVAMIEQNKTKILLGNPDGSKDDYLKIGCTKQEFEEISSFVETDRKFLIKQGQASTIAKLDLTDYSYYIPILSASTEAIKLYEKIVKETGTNPNDWTIKLLDTIIENKEKLKNQTKEM